MGDGRWVEACGARQNLQNFTELLRLRACALLGLLGLIIFEPRNTQIKRRVEGCALLGRRCCYWEVLAVIWILCGGFEFTIHNSTFTTQHSPFRHRRCLPDAFFDDDDVAGAEGESFFAGVEGAVVNDMGSAISAHGDIFAIGNA